MAALQVFNAVPAERPEKVIGTHDGTFHCDECLAVAMLRMTPGFYNAAVVRTRNPEELAKCDVVVDVGGVYEPEKLRFDHHQKEFQGTMDTGIKQYATRLSSAGLVYKHYGKNLVQGMSPADLSDDEVLRVYDRVYSTFMEHIDGIDNGVEQYRSPSGEPAVCNYAVTTTLSSRVGKLAPRWNQPQGPESFNEGFVKAVALTGAEFMEAVSYVAEAWLPASRIVRDALQRRKEVHASGRVMRLDQHCPWLDHLYDIERDLGISGDVLYCLFPDMKSGWRIRAVGVEGSGFALRKALPWKGLRDDKLVEASGIPGGVFVHVNGFIGGNATYEGALAMAAKALDME